MEKKYVSISKKFVLKNSENGTILLNLENGNIFNLKNDQIEFILLLDGTRQLSEIIELYKVESLEIISLFLKNLESLGVIVYKSIVEKIFFESKIVKSPRLESVHLEATGKCNMRCVDCYQGDLVLNGVNLQFDRLLSLVEEMQELQVEDVAISGGEPLMLEFLFLLINEIENRKMRISGVFTNGTLIDENFVSSIKGLTSRFPIYVSLDSIVGNLLRFRGIKDEISSNISAKIISNISLLVKEEIDVVVNTMINRENISSLHEMYDLMKKLKVKTWRLGFPKLTPLFKNNLSFNLDFEEASETCFSLIKRHLREGKPFDFQVEYLYRERLINQGLPNLNPNDFVCDYEGRKEQCCIKPNGDVTSCSFLNSMPIGNIQKQSLKDIWYSREMRKIKETRIREIDECKDCELLPWCGTGCRANSYFLHGDFFQGKDDFACKAVKFFKEKIYPFVTL